MPANPDSDFETASSIVDGILARQVSPTEIVLRALARLRRCAPRTGAFTQVFAQEARTAARALETTLSQGKPPGCLAGVPVVVKDMFDVAGHETTGGSLAYRRIATADAELVTRLRRAGAIIIAKTNQDELGCGSTGLASAYGPVRNPIDPARIPGGSSSGSAVAVAAGVVPLALGSDTGGSVRTPASFCGVFGLKAPLGTLPTRGALPMARSLDCPGLLAGSASDLMLAWQAVGGRSGSAGGRPPAFGVLDQGLFGEVSTEVHAALERAAETLRPVFPEVPCTEGELDDGPAVWGDIVWPELAAVHSGLRHREHLLLPRTAALLDYGRGVPAQRITAARRGAAMIRDWFDAQLRRTPILLAPATPYPAPLADADSVPVRDSRELDVHRGGPARLSKTVSLAGYPALSLPAGRAETGLPLAVQLIAGDVAILLDIAAILGPRLAEEQVRTPRSPSLPRQRPRRRAPT